MRDGTALIQQSKQLKVTSVGLVAESREARRNARVATADSRDVMQRCREGARARDARRTVDCGARVALTTLRTG